MTDLCAELLCLLQLSPNGQVPRILAARVAAPLAEVRDELGKLEGLGHVEFGERATEADDGGQGLAQSRVRITEAGGRPAGGRWPSPPRFRAPGASGKLDRSRPDGA